MKIGLSVSRSLANAVSSPKLYANLTRLLVGKSIPQAGALCFVQASYRMDIG